MLKWLWLGIAGEEFLLLCNHVSPVILCILVADTNLVVE